MSVWPSCLRSDYVFEPPESFSQLAGPIAVLDSLICRWVGSTPNHKQRRGKDQLFPDSDLSWLELGYPEVPSHALLAAKFVIQIHR